MPGEATTVMTFTGPTYGELIHRAFTALGHQQRIAWMRLEREPVGAHP